MSTSPIEAAYRAALLRRAQALPEAARQALQARLDAAVPRLPAAVVPAAPDVAGPGAGASPQSDLAALVQALQRQAGGEPTPPTGANGPADLGPLPNNPPSALLQASGQAPGQAPGSREPAGPSAAPAELKSVRQFRGAWKRLNAEQKLRQSRAQVPDKAGPLNTQRLVHRTLALMHAASPAYLQQFVQQVETLLALEAWAAAQPEPGARPAAAPRRKARGGSGGAGP